MAATTTTTTTTTTASVSPMSPDMDLKGWKTIYPTYLSAKKTVAEGRRVPANVAVIHPMLHEMVECCKYLKINCTVEPAKSYPRDWMNRGRIRVQLKDKDGNLLNEEYKTRRDVMLKMCELIPKSQHRLKAASAQNQPPKKEKTGKKKGKRK